MNFWPDPENFSGRQTGRPEFRIIRRVSIYVNGLVLPMHIAYRKNLNSS